MAGVFQWLVLLGLLCTLRVHASHFRGGIIMARPLSGGGENQVYLPVAASLCGWDVAFCVSCKFADLNQFRDLSSSCTL